MLLLQQRREMTHQTSNLAELHQLGADDEEDAAVGRHASGAELLRGAATLPEASLNALFHASDPIPNTGPTPTAGHSLQ